MQRLKSNNYSNSNTVTSVSDRNFITRLLNKNSY